MGLQGPEQAEWLDWLEAEHDNYRAVLGLALEQGDGEFALRLAAGLQRFWEMRGYAGEGRTWLDRALAAGKGHAPELRATAHNAAGHLSLDLGDYDGAWRHFDASRSLHQELDDRRGLAESLSGLGIVALNRQEYDEARARLGHALVIRREFGDRYGTAWSLYLLGIVAREQGDLVDADTLFQESLAMWREQGELARMAQSQVALGIVRRLERNADEAQYLIEDALTLLGALGHRFASGVACIQLGHLARLQADHRRAAERYAEALAHFEEVGAKEALVECVEWLACVATATGRRRWAGRLFAAATAARETLALPPPTTSDAAVLDEYLTTAKRAAPSGWDTAWADGRRMTLDQAIADARALIKEPGPAATPGY